MSKQRKRSESYLTIFEIKRETIIPKSPKTHVLFLVIYDTILRFLIKFLHLLGGYAKTFYLWIVNSNIFFVLEFSKSDWLKTIVRFVYFNILNKNKVITLE